MSHTRDFAPAHLERVLAIAETTYGTPVDPVAGSYIRTRQNFSAGIKVERRDLNDKADVASPRDVSDGIKRTEWSMPEMYLRPSGALGTEPEPALWLEAALGSKTTPSLSTTVASSPTTTSATLTSGSGIAVGDVIRFTASGKVARLVSVSGADVTWEPALATAPSTSDAVTVGPTYKLAADFTKSFSLYRYMHHTLEAFPGCWVNQLGIKFGLQTELEFTASGGGGGLYGRIGASKVADNPLTNVATTLNVTTGEGRLFDVQDLPFYALIESEVVKVTAQATDALTITRAQKSTSAVQHAQDTEVYPWVPSPTFAGAAISGVNGFMYFNAQDGVQRQFKIQSLEVQLTNGLDGRWSTGADTAYGVKRKDAVRVVQVNCTAYFTRLEANLLRDAAHRGEKVGVVAWAGSSSGAVAAMVLPRVIFDAVPIPDLPEGDEGMVTLSGRGYASGFSSDDALVIGFP